MKNTAAHARRIPVLSDLATGAAVVAVVAFEVIDDVADWVSRSRAPRVVAILATVVVLAVRS